MIRHYKRLHTGACFDGSSYVLSEAAELADALDIAVKEDHTRRRGQREKFALCRRQLSAGQARYQKGSEFEVNITDRTGHRAISIDRFRYTA